MLRKLLRLKNKGGLTETKLLCINRPLKRVGKQDGRNMVKKDGDIKPENVNCKKKKKILYVIEREVDIISDCN